jgi:chromosomal replication initiation ATPase DnaA
MELTNYQNKIIDIVCETLDMSRDRLFARTRLRDVVFARQIAFKVLYFNTELTLVKIGKIFGFNHDNIISGMRSLHDKMDTDKRCEDLFVTVQKKINEINE